MSFSVGFPNAGAITIGGQSPATINALSESTAETSPLASGSGDQDDATHVRTGGGTPAETKATSGGDQSIAVKILLKRMQELQQQLREQQQQLATAQVAPYSTPEAKDAVLMAIQGQVADTNGALLEVTGNLVKELAKGSGAGGLISTTA